MPIDYSKYPKNWKSEIRPAILERDGNCCSFCKLRNGEYVFRGYLDGKEVYQYSDGSVHDAVNGDFIEQNVYAIIESLSGDINQKAIKVVLTVMHLDHNIENNEYSNLKSGCQKCHLNYDKEHHRENAKATKAKKKKLQSLFLRQIN